MPLHSTLSSIKNVLESDKQHMYALYCKYFTNTDFGRFYGDMNEKDWVIIQRHHGEIVGFSTHKLIPLMVNGHKKLFLFSGDTLIDQKYRAKSTLAGSFGHLLLYLIKEYPQAPLYWFLISKGFRTYRFLPVYFRLFFPVWNALTPPEYQILLNTVAAHRFGSAFLPGKGLISFGGKKDKLKTEMSEIPPSREKDPHVLFFMKTNPGYRDGDELACITDITRENLNEYAWRVIQNTQVQWNV